MKMIPEAEKEVEAEKVAAAKATADLAKARDRAAANYQKN